MARPRRYSDSALINAAAAAIAERGGAAWSLDDVAARTGMSPAALVKRFGSKRGLLRAVVEAWVGSIPDPPAGEIDDPLGALETHIREQFSGIEPASAAGHFGLLLAELADEEIRGLVGNGWRRQEAVYAGLLAAARRAGEIGGPASDIGGAIVMAMTQGLAMRWSVEPVGSLEALQVEALRVLVDGWR